MKKFIISDNGSVGFDTETEEIFSLDTQREGISRIFMAQEPMTVTVKKTGKEYEMSAKKDDLIIVFYDSDFDLPAIVVKSKDWVRNLKNYEKTLQKRKEEWAKNKGKCLECDGDSSETNLTDK